MCFSANDKYITIILTSLVVLLKGCRWPCILVLCVATCHAQLHCRVVVVEVVVGHALSCHCGMSVCPCHARPRGQFVVVVVVESVVE